MDSIHSNIDFIWTDALVAEYSLDKNITISEFKRKIIQRGQHEISQAISLLEQNGYSVIKYSEDGLATKDLSITQARIDAFNAARDCTFHGALDGSSSYSYSFKTVEDYIYYLSQNINDGKPIRI